jgi:chlorophyllide a reductase subunit Y
VVVINLCVPTASGVPLDLLPAEINGVRVIGIDVPGFGVPTHAEAKDVLAAAMLRYARSEAEAGPVARPGSLAQRQGRPGVTLAGEIFPVDAITINRLLEPLGLAAGPVLPTREWRELYAALDCELLAMLHPFYTASQREFAAAGRPAVGSAPVGREGTAEWLERIARAMNIPDAALDAAKQAVLPGMGEALAASPIRSRITLSGYEGSELIVGRLLVESGADLRYVGTACPRTPWSEQDCDWLEQHGVEVRFRASLETDLAAMKAFEPDLAIGTTPVVQRAKELAIPSLYFTNLISARPLMGPMGVGSLAQVINTAADGRERFAEMEAFFAGVGSRESAGIWTPELADAADLGEMAVEGSA